MSKNWQRCQLGDVLNLVNGRAYKKEEMLTEGVPILRIQNLNGGNKWFYSQLELAEDKYCYKDDLLYAWSATFGPYWSRWDHKLIYHYHIWKIETFSVLYKQFAYYALWNITEALKASAHGVAMPHITKAGMEAWEIELPPFAEQKIISEKLDTLLAQVDSTKARLEKIPKMLKRFRQAVLAAAVSGRLISNLNNDNSHRKNLKFEDILKSKKQLSYGVLKPGDYDEHGVPMIRVMDIGEWGNFNKTDIFKISQSLSFEFKRTIVEEGDVVLSIMATIGRAAIVPKHLAGANVNRALAVIKLSDQVIPKYILLQLHSPQFQESFVDKQMGSAQKRINLADLRMFDIWIPSIEHQHEIVRRVEQLFVYADTIEKQVNNALTRVNNLTQSILAKAFRGELTAQWRAENPELISGENSAAALLEKIKAERAASGSKKASRKKT